MRFIKAHFKNFRLLRDLELQFSTDPEKHLTVFRAQNESGKTTTLTALQWALFGDAALPGGGKDFRLHPIDWKVSEGSRVPIEVSLHFEHTYYNPGPGGEFIEQVKRFQLVRTTTEEILEDGKSWEKRPSTLRLYEIRESGMHPVEPAEPAIDDMLPLKLREVFFTDGDRALSFIESDVSAATKRKRVQDAIDALLGFDTINNAIRHVNEAVKDTNKKISSSDPNSELSRIATSISQMQDEYKEAKEAHATALTNLSNVQASLTDIQKKIEAVLVRGDETELKRDIENTRSRLETYTKQQEALEKKHSELFKSPYIATELLNPYILKATDILKVLKDRGKIPSSTIPVIKERLEIEECICGSPLDQESPEGKAKRALLEKIIADQDKEEGLIQQLTDLFYRLNNYSSAPTESKWAQAYNEILNDTFSVKKLIKDAETKQRELEVRINNLGNTDIDILRQQQKGFLRAQSEYNEDRFRLESEIHTLDSEIKDAEIRRSRLLKEQGKNQLILSQLEVTKDIKTVLENTREAIMNEELRRVSDKMNELFIAMIGSDPEQGAIICSTEITDEFDIVVYGPDDRTLDPDRDLNGASRRALTIAFILALTLVSKVHAPNVIDTPLGMMAGYVKRSVLEIAEQHSTQLVLFLTRSEIEGCEDLIDQYAGSITTLTNPAHYPIMLKNSPGTDSMRILSCGCNHRQYCQICQRIEDDEQQDSALVTKDKMILGV